MKTNKTYQTVTLEDIKSVLQADKGWKIVEDPKSKEFIFEFPLSASPWIVVRVASSIVSSGVSRGCGKDAIRVFAVDLKNNRGYIKTKRVYRIGTWAKNLHNAVLDCFYNAKCRRDGV
jgi:hypothetical protein